MRARWTTMKLPGVTVGLLRMGVWESPEMRSLSTEKPWERANDRQTPRPSSIG